MIDFNEELTRAATVDLVKFLRQLSKMPPVQILGVAQILKIPVSTAAQIPSNEKDITFRPVEDISFEIAMAYLQLDRKRRRNLQKLMREAK